MKNHYGIKLTVDGHAVPVKLKDTLESLQAQVGGYIENVPRVADEIILVNEEGRLCGLPWNPLASALSMQSIVGEALMLAGNDGDNYKYYSERYSNQLARQLNRYAARCGICREAQP